MGISGLLPALKPIQVTKHLSEFSGQTLAVDAYVWLHKGVFSCATELATGKKTTKYVDYAMHRVRLLRHHQIEPYVVFDGGPLPAKKGTESDRKKKREEHLTRGKALAAQGKHTQARECYVKCVDVTPQMAFQFIKALRAESVPYVVAPYEADAQLAYLERVGLVDGIITEDSDLLVFGCQNVLFKLDPVASSIISISRKDFASITNSCSDISLVGWSDVQFRAMAILSGCDYLPSIPGIGLKTACTLLRKWKTAEQVIRAVVLEGKKTVPQGYMKQYRLAEKCFQHQRVYSPVEEKLVHLTPIDGDWDEEFDEYVGNDLDPASAKNLALGNVDPATLLPMIDINPSFVPRALKPIPMVTNSPSKKGKSKAAGKPASSGGILSFFGPNPVIPSRSKPSPFTFKQAPKGKGMAGKASGKRTLAEVMDQDIARKKHCQSPPPKFITQSKFFGKAGERTTSLHRRHSAEIGLSIPGPSRVQDEEKENIYIVLDEDDRDAPEVELDGSDVSMCAQGYLDSEVDYVDMEDVKTVEQEDGYLSPTPSNCREAQDLSSPLRSVQRPTWKRPKLGYGIQRSGYEEETLAESLSSPTPAPRNRRSCSPRISYIASPDFDRPTPTRRSVSVGLGRVLVHDTPTPSSRLGRSRALPEFPIMYPGPDLRSALGVDLVSDLSGELDAAGADDDSTSGSASPPSPSPDTPVSAPVPRPQVVIDVDEFDLFDAEEQIRANATRTKAVMQGWRERWALNTTTSNNKRMTLPKAQTGSHNLKRSNTNVTPVGRHSLSRSGALAPRSVPINKKSGLGIKESNVKFPRHSLGTFESKRVAQMVVIPDDADDDDIISASSPVAGKLTFELEEEGMVVRAQSRLAQFRCI